MTITAKEIADLRAKTGIGMMECKKALEEAGGDAEKAIEVLRKRGIAKAEKRAERETNAGLVESYVHANGRIGVLVEVLSETDFVAKNEDFRNFAHDVALHIAAMNPKYVGKDNVPADVLEKEKEDLKEQAQESGKPAEIIEKMIEGRLNKYYEEVCLINQPFVKDPEKTVGDLLTDLTSKIGEKIVVARFCRFEVGE